MSLQYDYEPNEITSTEDFLKDEREVAKKARRERRNRKRYKFSDKAHSKWGISSVILGSLGLVCVFLSIALSAMAGGNGGEIVGYVCLVSFILSFAGIVVGLLAFRETDVFLKSAWIGVFLSGGVWLFDGIMIIAGM